MNPTQHSSHFHRLSMYSFKKTSKLSLQQNGFPVILQSIKYFLTSKSFEVRIEEQRPSVHNLRRMRSYDYCGKGNLPKRKESHVLEAGSAIE